MKDKTQNGMWGSIFKEHLHNPHSLLPNSVNSAFLQHSMCVVFGYYWCIILGGWDGVGKKGDGLGSFLLKFGEMVKQKKEQLGGRSQDGGGIGRGDHFLFYKFIERTTER